MKKQAESARKSTVFTLRLEPKLRFALDLLARKRHRTMTSVIEWALHKAIEDQDSGLFIRNALDDSTKNILDDVWDTEPADRFIKLAMNYPSLLTFDEDRLWKVIREDEELCRAGMFPNYPAIREQWEKLKVDFGIKE